MRSILSHIREYRALRRLRRLPEEEKKKLAEALIKLAIGIEGVTVFDVKLEEDAK